MDFGVLTLEGLLTVTDVSMRVRELGQAIDQDYQSLNPMFVVILNGAFMFAADLIKHITTESRVSFIQSSSYQDMQKTGQIKSILGLRENIFRENIVILPNAPPENILKTLIKPFD